MARFACPACQTVITSSQPIAPGTSVQCPKCRHAFACPAEVAAAFAITATPAAAPPIDTVCPACGLKGRFPAALLGKNVKCCQCGAVHGVVAAPAPVEVAPSRGPTRRKLPLPVIMGLASLAVFVFLFGAALFAFNRPSSKNATETKVVAAVTTPAPAAKGQPAPQPAAKAPAMLPGFDDWMQDLEAAKARATRENKDILILFDGSDWCGWSMRLANAVLFQSEFKYAVTQKYVLVLIDFPRRPPALAKVQNPARNERLQEQFGITGFPTVVLTDAQGLPYATEGYLAGGPRDYLTRLDQLQQIRIRRDQLFAAVQQAQGTAKLVAAKKAYEFLEDSRFQSHYGAQLQSWYQLARQHDPKNEDAFVEFFFEVGWYQRLREVNMSQPNQATQWASQLDDFKKSYPFRDPNRGANLHLAAAGVMTETGRADLSRRYLDGAVACKPTDPAIKQRLTAAGAR